MDGKAAGGAVPVPKARRPSSLTVRGADLSFHAPHSDPDSAPLLHPQIRCLTAFVELPRPSEASWQDAWGPIMQRAAAFLKEGAAKLTAITSLGACRQTGRSWRRCSGRGMKS